jgi:hypothetical protein
MTCGRQDIFGEDRFGCANSALYFAHFTDRYCTVPAGNYFNSPTFTIMLWIKPVNQQMMWDSIFEFGNGWAVDSVCFSATSIDIPQFMGNGVAIMRGPSIQVNGYFSWTQNAISYTTVIMPLGSWTHLTLVFDGSSYFFYMNGSIVSLESSLAPAPNKVSRKNCYFGYTPSGLGKSINAYLDDIKFYARLLTPTEIMSDFNLP